MKAGLAEKENESIRTGNNQQQRMMWITIENKIR